MKRKDAPIKITHLKVEVLKKCFEEYFEKSLKYFPAYYVNRVFPHHSIITNHMAYICPLCADSLIWLDIFHRYIVTEYFTADHYPARNSGGMKTILVCKTCNNEAGHKYDYTLKQHIDYTSFQKKIPNSILPVITTIPNHSGRFRGYYRIDENKKLILHDKINPNVPIPPLDDFMKKFSDDANNTFNITNQIPDNIKVNQALLHAAYLYCFEYFGYDFVFSDAGSLIRKVLRRDDIYSSNVSDINLDTPELLQTIPIGLCYITVPEELKSFTVNIKLISQQTGYTTIKTVLIPNPTSTGLNDLKRQGEILLTYEGEIKMVPLNNYLKLGFPRAYQKMWADLKRDYSGG